MADESSRRRETRVFKHSTLEIFLLAIILIGLAFMVKTIFATPERSTSRLASTVSSLQQKVVEISESLQQKQSEGQGGEAGLIAEVKSLQEAVRDLKDRIAQIQDESQKQIRKQEEELKLLNQRMVKYSQTLEQRISALEETARQTSQAAER
jgi:TolA-binding protein